MTRFYRLGLEFELPCHPESLPKGSSVGVL